MKKVLIITALLFVACGGSKQKKVETTSTKTDTIEILNDGHNAENSLDYMGVYTGVFPAADCPGIQIRLEMHSDGSYTMLSHYIDRKGDFTETGKYEVREDTLTLTPEKGGEVSLFRVEEGRLRKLDSAGQVITGNLAEHYVLNQIEVNVE
jgi:uncharacterized lipoprotein NlpE involved in copper resistance